MEIEKGIPIPKSPKARSELLDLLHQMEVGDSVLTQDSMNSLIKKKNKVKDKTFTIRKLDNGIRIWRTA